MKPHRMYLKKCQAPIKKGKVILNVIGWRAREAQRKEELRRAEAQAYLERIAKGGAA